MSFWDRRAYVESREEEQRIDPMRVMPDNVMDKILGSLDKTSLATAASVSRQWSAAAMPQLRTRPSPSVVHALHDRSNGSFALRVLVATVDNWALVLEYARTHGEAGVARVAHSFLLWVFVAVLWFPLLFARQYARLLILEALQVALLLLPGSRRAPLFARICLAVITVALVMEDARALQWLCVRHTWWALPFVCACCVAVVLSSVVASHAPAAVAQVVGVQPPPLPLFFSRHGQELVACRALGWLFTAAAAASNVSVGATVLVLLVVGRFPLPHIAHTLPLALLSLVVHSAIVQRFDVFLSGVPVIAVLVFAFLGKVGGRWFEKDALVGAKYYQRGARAMVIIVAIAWFFK